MRPTESRNRRELVAERIVDEDEAWKKKKKKVKKGNKTKPWPKVFFFRSRQRGGREYQDVEFVRRKDFG